jgi:hypothetical protein
MLEPSRNASKVPMIAQNLVLLQDQGFAPKRAPFAPRTLSFALIGLSWIADSAVAGEEPVPPQRLSPRVVWACGSTVWPCDARETRAAPIYWRAPQCAARCIPLPFRNAQFQRTNR